MTNPRVRKFYFSVLKDVDPENYNDAVNIIKTRLWPSVSQDEVLMYIRKKIKTYEKQGKKMSPIMEIIYSQPMPPSMAPIVTPSVRKFYFKVLRDLKPKNFDEILNVITNRLWPSVSKDEVLTFMKARLGRCEKRREKLSPVLAVFKKHENEMLKAGATGGKAELLKDDATGGKARAIRGKTEMLKDDATGGKDRATRGKAEMLKDDVTGGKARAIRGKAEILKDDATGGKARATRGKTEMLKDDVTGGKARPTRGKAEMLKDDATKGKVEKKLIKPQRGDGKKTIKDVFFTGHASNTPVDENLSKMFKTFKPTKTRN